MHFPKISFLSSSTKLSSAAPPKDIIASPIGAGIAEPLDDHYTYFSHTLKWIAETKQKLPAATTRIRREAFLADPLLKGTICPYLKNVLLKSFTIQTKDNKLYAEAIAEITDYLETLDIMQVFREDFLDYAILDGHSYRRMDPDQDGNIVKLERIEPSTVEVYNDPWDSSIIAYHQKAVVRKSWSLIGTIEEVDSWFIPYGNDLADTRSTFIQDRELGNDPRVYELFNRYKDQYSITDISNLRIAATERIIAMHNSKKLTTQNYYDEYYHREIDNPAPIDTVLLAIWLKRLLLTNAPNLVYVVLSPFLHLKSGIIKEVKDAMGNTSLVSSIPQKPSTALQNANPELYNAQLANFNSWNEAMGKAAKNLLDCLKNGGVFGSGPDNEIKPIESSKSVSYQFIKGLIDQLNEEICLAFGLPIALISAQGTELASSRNIVQVFNNTQAGKRTDYESKANDLIKRQFAGKNKTWKGTITKGDTETTITYTFEDMKAHFVLDIPDTKDLLNEAQTFQAKADTLVKVKSIGASKDDIQALGEEYGFGLLGLDNYNSPAGPVDNTQEGNAGTNGPSAAQANAFLKACLWQVIQEQGTVSSNPTDPSGFKDKTITKRLQEAYQTAKETIDKLFEDD